MKSKFGAMPVYSWKEANDDLKSFIILVPYYVRLISLALFHSCIFLGYISMVLAVGVND